MSDELLSCPFCGGSAFLDHDHACGVSFVACGGCGAVTPACRSDKDAIAAWNRRAPTSEETQTQIAELKANRDRVLWAVGRILRARAGIARSAFVSPALRSPERLRGSHG